MKHSLPRHMARFVMGLLGCSSLFADDVRFGSPFSDPMVLQRDKPAAVWGWADPGESVTVSFAGQSKSAIAGQEGKWEIGLDALAASAEPRPLTATCRNGRKIEAADVLVGEVAFPNG